MEVDQEKPEWWLRNEEDRAALDLPPYEPSRFEDGTYLHEVVREIERKHSCEIQFIGVNTDYLDEWEVRIDGEDVFSIGRSRDDRGNTIFHMSADRFASEIEQEISS